jgi:hypothetical protein
MKTSKSMTLVAGLLVLTGCSSRGPGRVEDLRDSPPSINDLADLLKGAGNPPSQLSDLEKGRRMHPAAYDAVKKGDIVVIWGTAPKGEGDVAKGDAQEIIAYEKDVPAAGGWVLLSGGTVKKLTAAEFAAARKGGKPG